MAREMASAACLGGRSRVRGTEDRASNLGADQVVGQLGTIALHKYLFGHTFLYRVSRWQANLDPLRGDGGYDVPGCRVDVKTSRMRYSQDPLSYRLAVRPAERHEGWTYVLALVPDVEGQVILAGWAHDDQLPAAPETSGTFAGAYVIQSRNLNPMMPLEWTA